MSILTYTTYNDVRAALGVTVKDLADETLALQLYSDTLDSELEEVDADLATIFADASAAVPPSAAQSRLLRSARQFATFALAKTLAPSLPVFARKQITDGKAALTRYDDPLKEVLKDLTQKYQASRDRLLSAIQALDGATASSTPRLYFAVASPSSDPVTG